MIQDLHHALVELAKEQQQEAQEPEVWNAMRSKLQSLEKEVNDWNLPDRSDFSGIARGLRSAFRRGRKAFQQACDHPRSEQLHAWRKRAKDHWYHMRLLRKSWPEVFEGYIAALDQLETVLGDHHNLVLLEKFLSEESGTSGPAEALEALHTALRDRREELLRTARQPGVESTPSAPVSWSSERREPGRHGREMRTTIDAILSRCPYGSQIMADLTNI